MLFILNVRGVSWDYVTEHIRIEQIGTEQNRTKRNRKEQYRAEQNRKEQIRTEQYRTGQNLMLFILKVAGVGCWFQNRILLLTYTEKFPINNKNVLHADFLCIKAPICKIISKLVT